MIHEPHYTPAQLAKLWNVSGRTIRRLFYDEPGVLKIGESGRRRKRDHITLRIPESVAARVYRERSRGFAETQVLNGRV